MLSVESAAQAEQLTLAYRRFIELHGRALADPASGCSIASLGGDDGESRIFTFWSRRAAEKFDWFWSRYQPLYGSPRAPACAAPDRAGVAARH